MTDQPVFFDQRSQRAPTRKELEEHLANIRQTLAAHYIGTTPLEPTQVSNHIGLEQQYVQMIERMPADDGSTTQNQS